MESQNGTSSPLQRIIIGVGTLIVVILTVIAAIFVAMQSQPVDEATPISQQSPVAIATTITPVLPSPTFTPVPSPSNTTTTATLEPPTPILPINTDTPVALPPTFTATPAVIVVTATPLPPTPTSPPPSTSGCPGTPPNWVEYITQTGDTLNSLAGRVNVSVFDLQQANCLTSFTLQAGQRLYLPFTPPPPTVTPTNIPSATITPQPPSTPIPIAPTINEIVPTNVANSSTEFFITVLGRNFRTQEAGFIVELRGPQGVILQLRDIGSDTSFTAIVPAGLPVGTYDLVVTNANNRSGIKKSAFSIGPTPTPTSTFTPTPTVTPTPTLTPTP